MWTEEWKHGATQHSCGYQRDVCGNPSTAWYPQRHVCRVSMEESAARREYDRIHEARPWHDGTFAKWSSERTSATPYRYDDGVEISVAQVDLNPGDEFLKPTNLFAFADPDA